MFISSVFYKSFIWLILQSEIGRRSAGDNVLEREGYAVSAGFSLGLVALGMDSKKPISIKKCAMLAMTNHVTVNEGRGYDALGIMHSLVDRLFHYIGGKEVHNVCC